MNKTSPLDIRVAVLYSGRSDLSAPSRSPLSIQSQDRLTSALVLSTQAPAINQLFQRLPTYPIHRAQSKFSYHIIRLRFLIIQMLEAIKTAWEGLGKEQEWESYPCRALQVPQLPYPSFETHALPRFFWHSALPKKKDEYTPPCLMSDSKEEDSHLIFSSETLFSSLPNKGILRKDPDGFVYLELSDRFVLDLFPFFADQTCEIAPLPALVPVMKPEEYREGKKWSEVKEIGKDFRFEIQGCYFLRPKRWPEMEEVYFLSLKSKELERLREKYLLPSRLHAHDFHVPIAVKRAKKRTKQGDEIFRLNVSCFAA